jgi:hypothetical protein
VLVEVKVRVGVEVVVGVEVEVLLKTGVIVEVEVGGTGVGVAAVGEVGALLQAVSKAEILTVNKMNAARIWNSFKFFMSPP